MSLFEEIDKLNPVGRIVPTQPFSEKLPPSVKQATARGVPPDTGAYPTAQVGLTLTANPAPVRFVSAVMVYPLVSLGRTQAANPNQTTSKSFICSIDIGNLRIPLQPCRLSGEMLCNPYPGIHDWQFSVSTIEQPDFAAPCGHMHEAIQKNTCPCECNHYDSDLPIKMMPYPAPPAGVAPLLNPPIREHASPVNTYVCECKNGGSNQVRAR